MDRSMAFLGFSTFMTCRVIAQHQPLDANPVVMMDLSTVAVFIISSLLWWWCCCFDLFRLDDARLNLNKYTQYFHRLIGSKHTQNHGGNGMLYIYLCVLIYLLMHPLWPFSSFYVDVLYMYKFLIYNLYSGFFHVRTCFEFFQSFCL